MPAIPEFLLRKLFVQGSLQATPDGFSFALKNTFAPATVTGFRLDVNGKQVSEEQMSLQAEGDDTLPIATISTQSPYAFSVGVLYTIRVQGLQPGRLTLHVDTIEAGALSFDLPVAAAQAGRAGGRGAQKGTGGWGDWLGRLFPQPALKAEAQIDAQGVIGEISPYVYGHFIEHLERCIYGGIWNEDGSSLRPDTLALTQALRPPLVRYPGGNFASGYHWEDGIGPQAQRPERFDKAWNASDSNRVGTDEFMAWCAQVKTVPFLVVNDGSGTPEEAARWVAYCNQPASGEQGRRRAANGYPEPYNVYVWGVGNEVWGEWQIGHTGAQEYVTRLRQFVQAMRAVDSSIRIVAVGDKVLTNAPDDPGRLWNEIILCQAGDLIDDLSFHLYQPDREGWLERYDMDVLHHTVCAAPLDVETIIRRMAAQIASAVPGRKIGIAFDEWNLWLAPPEGAQSMHQVNYTLRDALYVAGMLNVFHRQCNVLSMANLAQLVNVLPAIVTDKRRAYATPVYYPFWMYQFMQPVALDAHVDVAAFDSQALGNIAAQQHAPYLDVTATRDASGRFLTLGLVNRHPQRKINARLSLQGFGKINPGRGWVLSGSSPLMYNSFDEPEAVRAQPASAPEMRGDVCEFHLPASSVTVQIFETNYSVKV